MALGPVSRFWNWVKTQWNRFKRWILALLFTPALAVSGLVATDNVIDKYHEFPDRYEYVMEQTLEDSGEAKVVLMKDEPKVELRKWDGEVAMGVKYNIQAEGSRQFLTERVEWKNEGNEEVHAYPLKPKEGMEDGGFEIEVVLSEAPATNRFDFTIEGYENLDFFYQPALTQEEIDEGSIRPENVVGSYAVYHKTKANHKVGEINYATGKLYHIPRPEIVDANGDKVWGELEYDNNGTLTVVAPQDFLDKAVYPVKVDPTFGNTSIGGSNLGIGSTRLEGSFFTPSEAGTINTFHAWGREDEFQDVNFKGVVVLSSTKAIITNGVSNGVQFSELPNPPVVAKSTTFATDPTFSASVAYILMIVTDTAGGSYYYDSSTNSQWRDVSNSYTTPVNPDDGDSFLADNNMSVYVTYTAAGGGGASVDGPKVIIFD